MRTFLALLMLYVCTFIWQTPTVEAQCGVGRVISDLADPFGGANDVNGDGNFDLSDVVFAASYLFIGGPPPCPLIIEENLLDDLCDRQPKTVAAGPDLRRFGVAAIEILESTETLGRFMLLAEDGTELGTTVLEGSLVEKNGVNITTERRIFLPADGSPPVSVALENSMPPGVVDRFPTAVIFEFEDNQVRISYDVVLTDLDLATASIEQIQVEANGDVLVLSADELEDPSVHDVYGKFLEGAGAEFVLDNLGINLAMNVPLDNQVIPFTPAGIFYLTESGDDHVVEGPIPEHSFWACAGACGVHAACYFGAQIPPPCWVACFICGWCLGEAIWGAF